MTEYIQIALPSDEKDLIKLAGRLLGLGHSSFSRMAALEKARQVIKLKTEEKN